MEKKRILVVGATGMLGHVVYHYLKKQNKYDLYNSVFRNRLTKDSIICNVKEEREIKMLFETTKPDVVINCIGALVLESKENPTSAIYLNALFPYLLRDYCDVYGAKLIHISTDCVFSGKKGRYSENDFTDAVDVYGKSKALGEIIDNKHCTLRTSIIGPELKENGTGLFHWFVNQQDQVTGYSYAMWGGVTTFELSKAIEKAIENNLKGLFHVTNGESISKYNLLKSLNEIFRVKNPLEIKSDNTYIVDKSLQKSRNFDFEIPSFQDMFIEMYNNSADQ